MFVIERDASSRDYALHVVDGGTNLHNTLSTDNKMFRSSTLCIRYVVLGYLAGFVLDKKDSKWARSHDRARNDRRLTNHQDVTRVAIGGKRMRDDIYVIRRALADFDFVDVHT